MKLDTPTARRPPAPAIPGSLASVRRAAAARGRQWRLAALLAVLGLVLPVRAADVPPALPPGNYEPREEKTLEMPSVRAEALREDALARAKVWREPEQPIPEADLSGKQGPFRPSDEVICKFLPRKARGRVPKFECVMDGGQVLKVKYGPSPELHTEVAAARLLETLGFGADRMHAVAKVRCFGCPRDPFVALSCFATPFEERRSSQCLNYGKKGPKGEFQMEVDYERYADFDEAVIERRMPGKAIETKDREGWSWDELVKIDPSRGGSSRAEVDGLRLMAVLLHNWDNKSENQRLVCLPNGEGPEGSCRQPFAFMHDVGAAFGGRGSSRERKMNLEGWSALPIWKDAATCLADIASPPFRGAHFPEVRISEPGRQFLAGLLQQLSQQQLWDLFAGARLATSQAKGAVVDPEGWVRAFQGKLRQIAERPPCPAS